MTGQQIITMFVPNMLPPAGLDLFANPSRSRSVTSFFHRLSRSKLTDGIRRDIVQQEGLHHFMDGDYFRMLRRKVAELA